MEEKDELCKLHSSIGLDGKERPRQSRPLSNPQPSPSASPERARQRENMYLRDMSRRKSQPLFHQNMPGNRVIPVSRAAGGNPSRASTARPR